jgi:hypothetical protein
MPKAQAMLLFSLHILACAVVGLTALDRKGGFVRYFLASLVLTPLATMLFLFFTEPKPGIAR